MATRQLPSWCTRRKDGAFVIDPTGYVPAVLKAVADQAKVDLAALDPRDESDAAKQTRRALEAGVAAPGRPDQYWIEVANQVAKRYVDDLVRNTELDPRRGGQRLQFYVPSRKGKGGWALIDFPVGRGVPPAREIQTHYERVVGLL